MRLTLAALARPITVVVALVALAVGATVAVRRMPVDIFPVVGDPAPPEDEERAEQQERQRGGREHGTLSPRRHAPLRALRQSVSVRASAVGGKARRSIERRPAAARSSGNRSACSRPGW